MVAFYRERDIDVEACLKITNYGQHLSSQVCRCKIFSFTEGYKYISANFREDFAAGSSIVFQCKAVVVETLHQKSTNKCKPFVGIDAVQTNPHLMYQPMSIGLYTHWDVHTRTKRITSRQSQTRSFENLVKSFSKLSRPDCKIEILYTTGRRNEMTVSVLMGSVLNASLCLEPRVAFITFTPVRRFVHLSPKKISNVVVGKESSMN